MKKFSELMEGLLEAWPGTKEHEKKFGPAPKSGLGSEGADGKKSGKRHDIETKGDIVRATRKYGKDGESVEPEVKADGSGEPVVKRGRGRPPGKYGSYKKKVKESVDFMQTLDEEQLEAYLGTLDEETLLELNDYLSEDVDQVDEAISTAKMSHQGKTTIKHIKNPDVTQRMAAHDIKPGVAGYRDRIDLLKDAQAKGKLKEEAEQIEELSKSSLANYVKKASHDIATKGAITRQLSNDSQAARDKQDYVNARKLNQKADKVFTKSWKRREMMGKAVDKLAAESVEQEQKIDESRSVDAIAALISKQAKEQ